MRPPRAPGSTEVLTYFVQAYPFQSVLDLGCGVGRLWDVLEGKRVVGVDRIAPDPGMARPWVEYVQADFMSWSTAWRPEAIFSSHVIEHMPDTRAFLVRFFSFIDEGAAWCLLWPPQQPGIRSGHLHHFNLGLMLYNLAAAGVDCTHVKMVRHSYTLGIMSTKKTVPAPEDNAIDRLAHLFPFPAKHNFQGEDPPGVVRL